MANFEEPSEELVKLFDGVRDKTTIPNWVEFKVLCNNKQKKAPVKLIKANELVELLTEGLNFVVVVNEDIFNELPLDMQKMAIDECLAGVGVSDTDTLSIEKPDFNTHTGVLKKYGHEPIVVLHESIKSVYVAQKEKEDESKALAKGTGKRGRKPKAKVG